MSGPATGGGGDDTADKRDQPAEQRGDLQGLLTDQPQHRCALHATDRSRAPRPATGPRVPAPPPDCRSPPVTVSHRVPSGRAELANHAARGRAIATANATRAGSALTTIWKSRPG